MKVPPVLIAPSLLACDFTRIGEEVRSVEAAGADWLHVDVMDGHYVRNLTLGPLIAHAVHGVATWPLDVHLMVTNPLDLAPDYVQAGASVLTFHREVADGAGCPAHHRSGSATAACPRWASRWTEPRRWNRSGSLSAKSTWC
ncbi:MAG: hypothetical protein R3E96_08075 [Planctomycetota bacterium]